MRLSCRVKGVWETKRVIKPQAQPKQEFPTPGGKWDVARQGTDKRTGHHFCRLPSLRHQEERS
jgi:hypothetical protein